MAKKSLAYLSYDERTVGRIAKHVVLISWRCDYTPVIPFLEPHICRYKHIQKPKILKPLLLNKILKRRFAYEVKLFSECVLEIFFIKYKSLKIRKFEDVMKYKKLIFAL